MTAEAVKVGVVDPKAEKAIVEEKPVEVQKADETFSPAVSGGVQNSCGNCPRDYNI